VDYNPASDVSQAITIVLRLMLPLISR